MIEHIYILVGIVAVAGIAIGAFLVGASVFLSAHHDSHYRGLLKQIDDTIDAIGKHYKRGEFLSEAAARKMLVALRNRHWPHMEDIKSNDMRVAKEPGDEHR